MESNDEDFIVSDYRKYNHDAAEVEFLRPAPQERLVSYFYNFLFDIDLFIFDSKLPNFFFHKDDAIIFLINNTYVNGIDGELAEKICIEDHDNERFDFNADVFPIFSFFFITWPLFTLFIIFELNLPFFEDLYLYFDQISFSILKEYIPLLFKVDFHLFDLSGFYSYPDEEDDEDVGDFIDFENENFKEAGAFSTTQAFTVEIFDHDILFNKFTHLFYIETFESALYSGTLIININ